MTWTRKRFYTSVEVAERPEGVGVTLDGRPIRTPAGALLIVPTEALARAIAAEWLAQTEEIRPATMPLTQLAATAIDRVAGARATVIAELVAYGLSDLVCYRAAGPNDLVARQQRCWQPLVDWFESAYGAALVVGAGVMPVGQPAAAAGAFERAFSAWSDLELTAVAALVQGSGSAVIGLAVAAGRLDVEAALLAAELDSCYQIERWGRDAEAEDRQRRVAADLVSAARFLDLARDRAEAVTARR